MVDELRFVVRPGSLNHFASLTATNPPLHAQNTRFYFARRRRVKRGENRQGKFAAQALP
jgi:hypothetical protein